MEISEIVLLTICILSMSYAIIINKKYKINALAYTEKRLIKWMDETVETVKIYESTKLKGEQLWDSQK